MLCACIDIGSNTTRVLVAEADGGRLTEVLQQREFTRIGKELRAEARISPLKVAEVAAIVREQWRLAESVGARQVRVVATAAIRDATNREDLLAAVRRECGLEVHILDGVEEARLAFVGATRTLGAPLDGDVAVVDVGGGSTEIAVGTVPGGATWSASFRLGSGALTDAYLHSDPPAASELNAMRQHSAGVLEGLEVPPADCAVAVGGSATSLRKLIGGVLDPDTLQRGLRVLSAEPAARVARRFSLDAERVRLLPAGILILEAASHRLGRPLTIGRGGIREGVLLEMFHGQGR
jgi:exopolyphosphatase/guanosine-5'-triphosphate,3'-diphosphate pyrophosphatase